MNLKNLEKYRRVNLLGSGPRLIKKYREAVSQRLRNTALDGFGEEKLLTSAGIESPTVQPVLK